MKHFISCMLLTCSLVFLVIRPADAQGPKQISDSAKLAGEWFLQPVLPSDTATGRTPSISFDLSKKKFTGFTGCNKMSGNFRIVGDALSFGKDIVSTKMACVGFNEKDFIANLLRVDHFQLTNGVLMLLINKTPISKWIRKTDKILMASR